MATINNIASVTIDELRKLIPAIGNSLTPVIQSEPGCGKTSLLNMIKEDLGDDYDYIYVDCPVKDMSDIAMTIPNHASKSLETYVGSLFKLDSPKPKVILLDEFMKSPKLLQVIFTRLMLERCVGDVELPKGSIVFATSNNASDGVGDSMLAHVGNRVTMLKMRKPSADDWNLWATAQGVARPIRAWAAMNPRAFYSYTDGGQEDNPYIFKPSSTAQQFVSPRSLAKASPIVESKDALGENLMMAMLAGTIGESAAKSMAAFIAVVNKVVRFETVIKSPTTVTMPEDVSAQVMMLFEAVDCIENQDDLSKYMQFVNRMPSSEVQSIFFTMIMRGKPRVARYNAEIMKWAADNHMLM
jgi:hypothetical protein